MKFFVNIRKDIVFLKYNLFNILKLLSLSNFKHFSKSYFYSKKSKWLRWRSFIYFNFMNSFKFFNRFSYNFKSKKLLLRSIKYSYLLRVILGNFYSKFRYNNFISLYNGIIKVRDKKHFGFVFPFINLYFYWINKFFKRRSLYFIKWRLFYGCNLNYFQIKLFKGKLRSIVLNILTSFLKISKIRNYKIKGRFFYKLFKLMLCFLKMFNIKHYFYNFMYKVKSRTIKSLSYYNYNYNCNISFNSLRSNYKFSEVVKLNNLINNSLVIPCSNKYISKRLNLFNKGKRLFSEYNYNCKYNYNKNKDLNNYLNSKVFWYKRFYNVRSKGLLDYYKFFLFCKYNKKYINFTINLFGKIPWLRRILIKSYSKSTFSINNFSDIVTYFKTGTYPYRLKRGNYRLVNTDVKPFINSFIFYKDSFNFSFYFKQSLDELGILDYCISSITNNKFYNVFWRKIFVFYLTRGFKVFFVRGGPKKHPDYSHTLRLFLNFYSDIFFSVDSGGVIIKSKKLQLAKLRNRYLSIRWLVLVVTFNRYFTKLSCLNSVKRFKSFNVSKGFCDVKGRVGDLRRCGSFRNAAWGGIMNRSKLIRFNCGVQTSYTVSAVTRWGSFSIVLSYLVDVI